MIQRTSWTSKRAQKNGPQYPKMRSIGSIGSIILAILEAQVNLGLWRVGFPFFSERVSGNRALVSWDPGRSVVPVVVARGITFASNTDCKCHGNGAATYNKGGKEFSCIERYTAVTTCL